MRQRRKRQRMLQESRQRQRQPPRRRQRGQHRQSRMQPPEREAQRERPWSAVTGCLPIHARDTGVFPVHSDIGKRLLQEPARNAGNMIVINHGNGLQTYYMHCSKIYVSAGTKVSKGQNIGAVGSTGNSTGPHLHFQVMSGGRPVNPMNYL